jgi:hypothetical protein
MNTGVIERSAENRPWSRRPSAAKAWLRAIDLTSRIEAEPRRLFADVVEDWAQRQPGRLALFFDDESFTYGALAARINRHARWARDLGIRPGRTVCLLMPNRPDYLACWLGISRWRSSTPAWSVSRSPTASTPHRPITSFLLPTVSMRSRPHVRTCDGCRKPGALAAEAQAPTWMRRWLPQTQAR